MRRLRVLLATVFFVVAPAGPARAGERVLLPAGTPLTIHVVETISSRTAEPGDTFEFRTGADVIASGYVVIPRDAAGRGTVLEVEHARGNGRPGRLLLGFDFVLAAGHERIRLSEAAPAATDAGAAQPSVLALRPAAGRAWTFAKNSVLEPGTAVTVYTAAPAHVVAERATALAADALGR